MGEGQRWKGLYLGAREDGGRDDFVGAEGLSGVDERGENLAALFAFRCGRCQLRYAGRRRVRECGSSRRGRVGVGLTRHRRREGVVETHRYWARLTALSRNLWP